MSESGPDRLRGGDGADPVTLLGAALAAEARHGVTLPAELIESCESVDEIDYWGYIIAAHRGA